MRNDVIRLNLYPQHEEAERFLREILPQLEACGLRVEWDSTNTQETKDGYKEVFIEIFDLNERVFSLAGEYLSYDTMADLAAVLESKQVELQLNALMPRMAAVGWRLEDAPDEEEKFWADPDADQKLVIYQNEGTAKEFNPSYGAINQLRQELTRTEAERYVQQRWLELEAVGCEITLGVDVMIARQGDCKRTYGYTLDEAQELVRTALIRDNA